MAFLLVAPSQPGPTTELPNTICSIVVRLSTSTLSCLFLPSRVVLTTFELIERDNNRRCFAIIYTCRFIALQFLAAIARQLVKHQKQVTIALQLKKKQSFVKLFNSLLPITEKSYFYFLWYYTTTL